MGHIHILRIVPGSNGESEFFKALESVDVKPEAVLCRHGLLFNTPYDEYILSEGLYRLIRSQMEKRQGFNRNG